LGSPQLLSRSGEPLRAEIPIRISADEEGALSSLKAMMPNKAAFERLGISQKILELNPQIMVYRNRQNQLMVLLETVEPVPISDDPFVDVIINLSWASGNITKTYTLLLGDVQKILVKPGQTLSEIAALMAPQLEGATLDQTMMALFKANPDAFASGSINRLAAGAELNKPSQALLRSISPAEANQFVADANEQWREGRDAGKSQEALKTGSSQSTESAQKDRLKIGSSADGSNDEQRFTEELVAQEKALEQAKARVAELEKNVADLQRLLDKSKEKKAVENNFGLGGFAPAILALGLILLTGLLLWALARNARRTELTAYGAPSSHSADDKQEPQLPRAMPERAKALFAGIDLDLTKLPEKKTSISSESNPLLDTLRVKLNLARAYIMIEDFSAAKKSLEEILNISSSVDLALTIEAQELLNELNSRKA
jgi:pilus assembly protein FimV